MITLSKAAMEFLTWAADDYTEAFVLRDILKRERGVLSGVDEKNSAMGVVSELLQNGLLRIGDMRTDTSGVAFWNAPAPALLLRLDAYWIPESPPSMGEGPWFYATEEGKVFLADNCSH